jgi:hypothetical protein
LNELIEWFYPEEIPQEKSFDIKDFSIEVLIFFPNSNSHAIGWYHFSVQNWFILTSAEKKDEFTWRFLRNDIDKTSEENSQNEKWFYPSEFPDELNMSDENKSIEVLIYVYNKKHHAVGYYNFIEKEWKSVFNNEQLHYKFYWRFFDLNYDEI